MDPERFRRVEAVFHTVVARPPADRSAVLDHACGGDSGLRAEVESLLEFHGDVGPLDGLTRRDAACVDEQTWGPAPGARIGTYLVGDLLGSGGMGAVFRSRDHEGTPVALKVLHPRLTPSDRSRRRFLREAEIGRRVRHPRVARTLDAFETEHDGRGLMVLVTELVAGRTLRTLLEEDGRLTEPLCRRLGLDVRAGLAAIHAEGIVHRDLKPENVIVGDDARATIVDLGIARLVDQAVALSRTGEFVGSVLYAAPEQFGIGSCVDRRADLHAFGVLLHEMITGRHPFDGGDFASVSSKIRTDVPEPLRGARSDVSGSFSDLVVSLLSKDPAARPDTDEAVRSALTAVTSPRPPVGSGKGGSSAWALLDRDERAVLGDAARSGDPFDPVEVAGKGPDALRRWRVLSRLADEGAVIEPRGSRYGFVEINSRRA